MNITTLKTLNKIKNSSVLNQEYTECSNCILTVNILKTLYKNGLINSYTIKPAKIQVFLRKMYNCVLTSKLKIVSKPSLQIKMSYNQIIRLNDRYSFYFFSTNLGILSSKECKKLRVGGTLLFIC